MPRRLARTVIHINRHVIRKNDKEGTEEPVITIKKGRSNVYAHEAFITGPCRIIYSPAHPLPCGAKVWIQTESEVIPVIREKL